MHMANVEELLELPLGKCISDQNWENLVYGLGDEWVYKEVKTEHQLAPDTKNYDMRHILQRYWCSQTHFENIERDQAIFNSRMSEWYPETYVTRAPARFSDNPGAIITVQKKLQGKLLKDLPGFTSDDLTALTKRIGELILTFDAPLDFHAGNIIIEDETEKVYFFDPGTPSDWHYFLDAERMVEAVVISCAQADDFVAFMQPIYEKHKNPLRTTS